MSSKAPWIVAAALLGLVATNAFAATQPPQTDTLSLYYQVTNSFIGTAKKAGASLLFGLLGMQITINGIKKLIRPAEMEGLISAIIWPLLSSVFFIALIQLSDTFLPRVIDGFDWLGQKASGGIILSPDTIITYGIDLAMQMDNTFNAAIGNSGWDLVKNVFPAMFLLFIQIVVVVAHLILGMQMALALINAYFWYCVTPILLGFGGLSYTKDMALSALKGGIAIGAKLMIIYFISAVSMSMAPLWGGLIGSISVDNMKPFWVVGTSVALLAYLAMQIPKLSSDLINGQASLTAGDAATNTMMGMAALATAGSGALAANQALKQAGASAVQTLGGLAQAGMSGLNSAHDLGKSGLSAAAHAAKEVANHGGSVVGGGIRDAVSNSTAGLRDGMGQSLGGQISNSIESQRGGSISSSSSGPSSSTGPGPSSSTGPGPSSSTGPGPSSSTSPGPSSSTSPGPSSSSGPGPSSSSDNPAAPSGLGDATNASVTGSNTPTTMEQIGAQLQDIAANMSGGNGGGNGGGQQKTLSEKIRDLSGHVPNDQATVGVSANLGSGHGGED